VADQLWLVTRIREEEWSRKPNLPKVSRIICGPRLQIHLWHCLILIFDLLTPKVDSFKLVC